MEAIGKPGKELGCIVLDWDFAMHHGFITISVQTAGSCVISTIREEYMDVMFEIQLRSTTEQDTT